LTWRGRQLQGTQTVDYMSRFVLPVSLMPAAIHQVYKLGQFPSTVVDGQPARIEVFLDLRGLTDLRFVESTHADNRGLMSDEYCHRMVPQYPSFGV
jgi:hypothetical protein